MKRRGFTLIEMLVVIAIIGICVAVTIPYFVEAQRGAALRNSAQTVIMTAKYARTMSILKQQDFALLMDRGAGQLELASLSAPPGAGDQDNFIDQRNARSFQFENSEPGSSSSADGMSDTNAPAVPLPVIKSEMVRDLEEGVSIKDLEVIGESGREKDVTWIFFSRAGTSSGFKVRIEDQRGNAAEIEMDGISGLIKSKMIAKGEI